MKQGILSFIVLFIGLTGYAQTFEWANSMAGAAARGMAMVTDAEGNVYVTGNVNGTTDFDPTANEAFTTTTGSNGNHFLVKYGPNGDYIWHVDIGSSGTEIPKGLAIDSQGDVIMVGRFDSYYDWDPGPETVQVISNGSNDGFAVKYDSDGNFKWVQQIGGSGHDESYSVDVDEFDNIYITGFIAQSTDFDNGEGVAELVVPDNSAQDGYLVKYSPDGVFDWVRGLQGPGSQMGFSVACGQHNDIYIHGTFSGDESVLDPDGEFQLIPYGSGDTFICRYDISGNLIWTKSMGGEGNDRGEVIIADGNGHIYIMGTYSETVDLDPGPGVDFHTAEGYGNQYFCKLDTLGNAVWSHAIHGVVHFDGVSDIAVDNEGSVYFTSPFFNEVDLSLGENIAVVEPVVAYDIYLVKYALNGDYIWHRIIRTEGVFDTANGLATDLFGNVFITGGYGYGAIFDSIAENGNQTGDVSMTGFVAKYGTALCENTTSNIEISECDVYITPSGTILTESGIYEDVIPNEAGCDSLITIDLEILNFSSATLDIISCGEYLSPSGNFTWTTDGYYEDTIANSVGCDSLITVNLIVLDSPSGVDLQTACNSFTWIDGVTYVESTDSVEFILENGAVNGCDSVAMLNLTILNSTTGTDLQTACESYTWIDGITYTESTDSVEFIIENGAVNGCDSVATLNLTILNSAAGTDIQTACESYTWIDGITYMESTDDVEFTIENGAANGCDSVVTLNLTISNIDSELTLDGPTISVETAGYAYQWVDCLDNLSPIEGEISQSFTAETSGEYAVQITNGECSELTECISITVISVEEELNKNLVLVYPSPNSGEFTVELGSLSNASLSLIGIDGQLIYKKENITEAFHTISVDVAAGIYVLQVRSGEYSENIQVVIEK